MPLWCFVALWVMVAGVAVYCVVELRAVRQRLGEIERTFRPRPYPWEVQNGDEAVREEDR